MGFPFLELFRASSRVRCDGDLPSKKCGFCDSMIAWDSYSHDVVMHDCPEK